MQFVPQVALDGDSKAGAGIAGEPRQVKVCMCLYDETERGNGVKKRGREVKGGQSRRVRVGKTEEITKGGKDVRAGSFVWEPV